MTTNKLPKEVQDVMYELYDNGYVSYVAGGAVRDLLLSKTPNDWDIATSATPIVMKQIFGEENCITIGERFGTISLRKTPIQITTFRVEGQYKDQRHPDTVKFVENAMFDSMRRDFTINSMLVDIEGNVIDFTGYGLTDLNNKTIRTVGNPVERFKEDPLRMLRAVRFASQLGFDIESETFDAIQNNADLIYTVAVERVRDELYKLLMGDYVELGLKQFYNTGLMHRCMLDVAKLKGVKQNERHYYNVFEHTIKTVKYTSTALPHIRLAALLHDVGKLKTKTGDKPEDIHFYGHEEAGVDIADKILTELKVANLHKQEILTIIENHLLPFRIFDDDRERIWTREKVTKIIRTIVPDMENKTPYYVKTKVNNFLSVCNGDYLAHYKDDGFLLDRMFRENSRLTLFNCIMGEITNLCVTPKPIIDGHVLLQMGVEPKLIGKVKKIVYWDYQIEKRITNINELRGIASMVLERLLKDESNKPEIKR